jgi:predicted ATPase
VGLLIDRWEQAKEGRGQVVLLSGEPGIGKSRLAYTLREQVTSEGSLLYEARCSPYHQHSALYPLIEVMQRTLVFTRHDTDEDKIEKLERVLTLYGMQESLPLFTALLSLPTPAHYPPLTVTPQKQKERTLQALLQVLLAQAERQATVSVWEDLHWADPSSLEFLSLLIDQLPTTKLLLVLTFRPEFTPPWKPRSHLSQLVLNRLGKKQVEVMIEQAATRDTLSAEVIEQIRLKTDGVPLFVEELTKSVVEARGQGTRDGGQGRKAAETLAIPATLQEALLARLDRLSTARQIAQLGATLGREFSYELLRAVTSTSESDLQSALVKLVEAEILYQRGIGEQARYFFKHALIQDTAYQSLLKSTRQQYHQQIALVLEERLPDTKATQPELLAHHYTEANLIERAVPYWELAGQQAMQQSAYIEAESYFMKGVALLQTLPDTLERAQHEVRLQTNLGHSFFATKGVSAPEAGRALTRAYDLCQRLADPMQLFAVLAGLRGYWNTRGEHGKALEQALQMLEIAKQVQDSGLLLQAVMSLGLSDFMRGEPTRAYEQLAQGTALYNPQQHASFALLYGYDLKMMCLTFASLSLWMLGYPDQALRKSQEALKFARGLSLPLTLAGTLFFASWFHLLRREEQEAATLSAEGIHLSTENGLPLFRALGECFLGQSLLRQGNIEDGLRHVQEALVFLDSVETGMMRSEILAYQAEAQKELGNAETGLSVLAQALAFVEKNDERYYEVELYRLKGELTLQKLSVVSSQLSDTDPRPLPFDPQGEAEACFLKALAIARQQQAKSWELRAATSLARLWQSQGKRPEAHKLLSEVYDWFTEGFDTKDLQEAKALVEDLS